MLKQHRDSAVSMRRVAMLAAASLLIAGAGIAPQGQEAASGRSGTSASQANTPPPPNVVNVVPAYRQADRIAVLPVTGVIDPLTLRSLERRIREAKRDGFDAVVIELNTPGGYVDAARDIVHLLKTDAPVNTVAWVNPQAYSAGTLLALACREIVVHPNAEWGDCAPIEVGLGMLIAMPPAERAKYEGPLRVTVVDSARRYGYDERLVEAFISVNLELWMIENSSTNERIFVTREEYRQIFGNDPPDQIAPGRPLTLEEAAVQRSMLRPAYDESLNTELRELDAMSPEQREAWMRNQVEREQSLPSRRAAVESLRADDWQLLRQVVSNSQLLTIRAVESIEYGLANAVIRNDHELCAYFGTANGDPARDLVRIHESWSENLVRFLMNGWVKATLIAIFIIGLFLELAAPGVGVFGAVAAGALLLLIGAPLLAGMAEWWQLIIILIGFVLIGVEVFVLPGVGVPGVLGVVCVLVGVVGSFVTGDPATPRGQEQLMRGIAWTVLAIFAGGVGVWLLTRWFREFPLFQRLVLSATIDQQGTEAALMAPPAGDTDEPVLHQGDEGVAETALRPAGRAIFNGRQYDVVSDGGWIEAGATVRIVNVGRYRVEVEPVD